MEQEFQLPLPDGKILYYVHTKAETPNRKVIVHVHGLSGWPYEVASTAMARQFPNDGYDVVRPYLYHWLEGTRKLHETTIAISAADVEKLIDKLAQDYEQIFVCGHSYGGPMTMSLRQKRLAAVSLWDPTYVPAMIEMKQNRGVRVEEFSIYKGGSFWFVVGDGYRDERLVWTQLYSQDLAKAWNKPLQVIHAANGMWVKYEGGESFHSNAKGPTDYRVIDGSVHCFVEGDTTQQLLSAVKDWFDQF